MNHMSKQKLSRVIVIIIICNLLLWHNAEFSASLRQSSVSHDPSEIILICWFAAQETFIIIYYVKRSCDNSCFCGKCDNFFLLLLQDSL